MGFSVNFSMGFSISFSIGFSNGFSNGFSMGFSTGFSISRSGSRSTGRSSASAGGGCGGGVLAPASNFAAIEAVEARRVLCVDEDTLRVGDLGASRRLEVLLDSRLCSHGGGFCEALLAAELRSGAGWVGVVGFSGELFGVDGLTVEAEGDWARGVLGRRKGDVRGLLKESGDGL